MQVKKVLIIGGGFSGLASGIELLKNGAEVEIVEKNANWKAYGAGITVIGPMLRCLEHLGLYEEFTKKGSVHNDIEIRLQNGNPMGTVPTFSAAGSKAPGIGAIMRPILGDIMADKYQELGGKVRVGCTFTTLEESADGVQVAFTDNTKGTYDVVIGADGLNSQVRETIIPNAPKPSPSGQGVWRAVMDRPKEAQSVIFWVHPTAHMKMGINPISKTQMYIFVNNNQGMERIEKSAQLSMLKDLVSQFEDPMIQKIANELNEDSQAIYRPLEYLLLEKPWYKGRIVLVGDAIHATTPHLAFGAGMGLEDGLAIAEELIKAPSIAQAFESYQNRRWERVSMVIRNSLRLGEIEKTGGDMQEHSTIMKESNIALNQPF